METKARNADEQKVFDLLAKIDQTHLYATIDQYTPEQRDQFVKQVIRSLLFKSFSFQLLSKPSCLSYPRSSILTLSTPVGWQTTTRMPYNVLLVLHSESIPTKAIAPRSLNVIISWENPRLYLNSGSCLWLPFWRTWRAWSYWSWRN